MTDGARQRSSTGGSSKDAADGKQAGGNVALKKEIGLVSACGIIVGEWTHLSRGGGPPAGGSGAAASGGRVYASPGAVTWFL